ncbi:uncharacterized protein LOC135490926 [Lineus longissimus]|uniref:uncharacterized protein LOC135490926 n=1 Tax=Lineus longissimus TaxID=88925 RepID=UPI002B4E9C8C
MRKIRLCEEDFGMFDDEISPSSYEYFLKHKDAFKRMWQDQGRKFWSRFLFCFKTFTLTHGAMKDFPAKPEHYEGIVDELFKYIYAEFVKGKYSQAKNLVMDVVVVAQSRHLIPHLESRSFAKDPFYHKETREVYRRLFGPPGEKESLLKVYFFLSLYLKFGGSVVECLRQWVGADLCASDDDMYLHGPNMETSNSPPVVKKTISKPDIISILSESFYLREDGEKMFHAELNYGDTKGPKFILEWAYGDPRIFENSENPLYDKDCDRTEDWRTGLNKLMYMRFLIFAKNYLKKTETEAESYVRMMTRGQEDVSLNGIDMKPKQRVKTEDLKVKGSSDVKPKSATVQKNAQVKPMDGTKPKAAPVNGRASPCGSKECLHRSNSGNSDGTRRGSPSVIVKEREGECCSSKNCVYRKKSDASVGTGTSADATKCRSPPVVVKGREGECCSSKNCVYRTKSDVSTAAEKSPLGMMGRKGIPVASGKESVVHASLGTEPHESAVPKNPVGKSQSAAVQAGTMKKNASTQCGPEPKQVKKLGGDSGSKGPDCRHKVDASGDKPAEKGCKPKEFKCTCPKSAKPNTKSGDSSKSSERAPWDKDYKLALEDIWKFKNKTANKKSKGKGLQSDLPNPHEISYEEEMSLLELCEKAKFEEYALDKSMRSLLPDKLVPDDFKIVHAEFLQSNSKKIEKRVKLIAVSQEGMNGKDLKQLTYTISFPKLKFGAKPSQPEVRVDGGIMTISGPRDDGDKDGDFDDLDMASATVEVKPHVKPEATEKKDLKPASKTFPTAKKTSAKMKEKFEYPEKFYIDGGSMHDVPMDDGFDFEGATGGDFVINEMVHVGKNCRICTTCLRPEPKPKTYKKCQKCKDLNVSKPRYYCGRECQAIDWRDRHKREHREGLLI